MIATPITPYNSNSGDNTLQNLGFIIYFANDIFLIIFKRGRYKTHCSVISILFVCWFVEENVHVLEEYEAEERQNTGMV